MDNIANEEITAPSRRFPKGRTAKPAIARRDSLGEIRNDLVSILTAVKAKDWYHAEVLAEVEIDYLDNLIAEEDIGWSR